MVAIGVLLAKCRATSLAREARPRHAADSADWPRPRFGDRGDRRRPLEPRWFELEVLASDVSELGAGFGEPIESGLVDDVGVRCRGFVASEEGLNFAKLLKDFVV